LSDIWDDEVPVEWLGEALEVIWRCKHLDFLLLSKRTHLWQMRLEKLLGVMATPEDQKPILRWLAGTPPPNVWIGATVETPDYYERINHFQIIPAEVHFLSVEPMLTRMDGIPLEHVEWVIAGGEDGGAGVKARPTAEAWLQELKDQCIAAGVPFFLKQWGEFMHRTNLKPRGIPPALPPVWWPKFPDE
jgi:protein gp37